MDTALAFFEFLAHFVPASIICSVIVTAFWAATKLFPKFGTMTDRMFDGAFGVDEDYDEKYETGYIYHANRQ